MAWVTSMDDLIYGEDGQSPIRSTLERVLQAAKRDETRLRIEVRSKGDGMPTTRQEHVFAADPSTTTAENVMQALVTRLTESPGEHFTGELRINFAAAGSSQERYGSFTRTIRRTPPNIRGAPGMSRMRIVEEDYNEDGEEVDNNAAALGAAGLDLDALSQMGHGNGGAWIPQEQQIQWLDTAFGFVFRSMAQQMAMFDRATRMMESYTLRFGMPNPVHPGIMEQKGGDGGSGSTGMGLLPMLMNAAAHLASANSPAEVVERAGSMAQGGAPPAGAARAAAIAGSANLVRGIPRNNPYRPEPTTRPFSPPDDPDLGGDGGGAGTYFDEPHFGPDPDTDAGDLTHYSPSEGKTGAPDLRGLGPEQVKEVFVQWVRDNPDNKQAVMAMLPDLAGEIT